MTPEEIDKYLLESQQRVETGNRDTGNRLAAPIGYSRKHGGLPPGKKSLGQNWLEDADIAREIAGLLAPEKGETVLEVGAGAGALTEALLETDADVIAVEIDRRMVEVLEKRWEKHPRLRIEHADILKVDWATVTGGDRFSMAGNLPFHITSSLLFQTLDHARLQPGMIRRIAIMVQLEVAKRIASLPGDSEYGILSVFMRFWGDPRLAMVVPKDAFKPQPKVDAGILLMDISPEPLHPLPDWQTLKRLVKGTFRMRRKMLRNSMSSIDKIAPWRDIEFDWTRRPQTLSAAEFAWLAERLIPLNAAKHGQNNG